MRNDHWIAYLYLYHTSRDLYLTCHKILWHGADGFTSAPKEVILWIFITLKKIHRFWPGFNPQTLGPVASKITITPPRMTIPSGNVSGTCAEEVAWMCQQAICNKVSDINWNQSTFVNCIKTKSHFSNMHIMRSTCTLGNAVYNYHFIISTAL
jgi:hypothetical protein